MKNKIIIWLCCIAAAAVIASLWLWNSTRGYREELQRVNEELSEWRQSGTQLVIRWDTIRDSIPVADQAVIEANTRELRRQHLVNEQLIKDLRLELSRLEAVQTTATETSDTVKASVSGDSNARVYSYSDRWTDIRLTLKDSTFYYNIRDSLSAYVYREYKHRFLWWRWGTKGYRLKLVNYNPHSRISYNQYIKVE